MRLFEIATPRLFLCTNDMRAIGSTVTGAGEAGNPLDAELEDILEAERPSGCVSRGESISLVTRPVGTTFTYVVHIEGRLERQHAGWLKRLAEADPMQDGVCRHYAIGYWSGKECDEERSEPWLYRAEAARVVSRMGRSSRDV